MELPAERPVWERSDAALIESVEAAGGEVLIGLKPLRAVRSRDANGLRPSLPAPDLRTALVELRSNGVEGDLIGDLGIVTATISPTTAPSIARLDWVDFVEPNIKLPIMGATRRVAAPIPAQTTPWGVSMVKSNVAWARSTGSGARVMTIDTGFDDGHEDLVDVIPSNCFNGGCNDGSGHGTHALGDLMARSNSVGYVGVARGVTAADTYVFEACDSNGCDLDDVVWGIYKADSLGIEVLNMSFGGDYSSSMATAYIAAWNGDVTMVAAASNNGTYVPVYPAAFQYVLSVSGVKTDKAFANSSPCSGVSSGYGSYIDVAAPFWSYAAEPGDTYAERCGNSVGAPHVAGIAALIRAKWPSFNNVQVRARIRDTADDLGASGYDQYFGHGLVNAQNALGPWASIGGPLTVQPNQICEWDLGGLVGGYGTKTYQWYKNGAYQGSGQWIELAVGSSGSFELKLVITDGQGISDTAVEWVSISAGGQECYW